MAGNKLRDLRILEVQKLDSPEEMASEIPVTEKALETVVKGRREAQGIIRREDNRFLLVVGPCSIHDTQQALVYASRLAELRSKYSDKLCIFMRVYFEKPRTALGWRGLIVDPGLDGTYDIQRGMKAARKLLVQINELGLPCGSELLDPFVPQYTSELLSWASIGARTTESQVHREMASGLSMPVGFKNATDGDMQIAVNGIISARHSHSFIGITRDGNACIMQTMGNPDCHLILRGGKSGPNYDGESVEKGVDLMKKAGIRPSIIVDCSHGNSNKNPENQPLVLDSVVQLRKSGVSSLLGCMVESNLEGGRQDIPADPSDLKYGVSVTDACLSWEKTSEALEKVYNCL